MLCANVFHFFLFILQMLDNHTQIVVCITFPSFYLLIQRMHEFRIFSDSFHPYLSLSFNRLKNLFISTWFHSSVCNTYSYSNEILSTSQLSYFVVVTRPYRTYYQPFYYSTFFFFHLCILVCYDSSNISIAKEVSYVRSEISFRHFSHWIIIIDCHHCVPPELVLSCKQSFGKCMQCPNFIRVFEFNQRHRSPFVITQHSSHNRPHIKGVLFALLNVQSKSK